MNAFLPLNSCTREMRHSQNELILPFVSPLPNLPGQDSIYRLQFFSRKGQSLARDWHARV